MEAWMQLEDPEMTVEDGRKELEAAGNKVMEIGTRYTYAIMVEGQKKVVPAWGEDKESAEIYLKNNYPGHFLDAQYVGKSHVGRCFKVAEVSEPLL